MASRFRSSGYRQVRRSVCLRSRLRRLGRHFRLHPRRSRGHRTRRRNLAWPRRQTRSKASESEWAFAYRYLSIPTAQMECSEIRYFGEASDARFHAFSVEARGIDAGHRSHPDRTLTSRSTPPKAAPRLDSPRDHQPNPERAASSGTQNSESCARMGMPRASSGSMTRVCIERQASLR